MSARLTMSVTEIFSKDFSRSKDKNASRIIRRERSALRYSFFSAIPSGIKDLEAFLDANTEHTVKYVIDKKLRWELRDILDQFNINERMIQPGTAGIAKWLARHYYVKSE